MPEEKETRRIPRLDDTDATQILGSREKKDLEERVVPVPARIGRYEVQREVGRGGMGVVYEAKDPSLGRRLAVKVLTFSGRDPEEGKQRFRLEAHTVANLTHPNIVTIHDFGDEQGLYYYTMDFIEGKNLDDVIQAEGQIPPVQAAELIEQLARAAHYAHRKGVIHRDFKPGNVIIDENGAPHILDFGLAKFVHHHDTAITADGVIVGTPLYMSPEQAQGESSAVDERSDVYSLGAMLYEMLCGEPPFQHENQYKLLNLIAEREPVPLRNRGTRIHRDLETICMKCLEKRPEKRYQSAVALAEDLRAFLSGEPIRARPVSRLRRFIRRLRPAYDAIAVGFFAVVIIASVVVYYARRVEQAVVEEADKARFGWTRAYTEGFDGDSLPEGWLPGEGRWWVENGWLYGTGTGNTFIYLDRPFPGDVRVEVCCRPQGSEVGVSLLGTDEDPVDGGYFLSLRSGASKISKCGATLLGESRLVLPSDRDITVVAERQGGSVRIYVKGDPAVAIEYDDPLPIGGKEHAFVGLYTFNGTIAVDSVSIHRVAWPEVTIDFAEQLLRKGEYRLAWEAFLELVQSTKEPATRAQALFGAARSVEAQGSFNKAAEYYRILTQHPDTEGFPKLREKALFRAARCLLSAGLQKEAAALLKAAESEYPVADEWCIIVAYHMEEAEALMQRERILRRNNPEHKTPDPPPWKAQYQQAEALLARIDTPEIRRSAARALARTYMERGGVDDLLKAVALDPDNTLILVRLSDFYLAHRQPEQALVHADKAAQQGANTKEVRIARGNALFALGRYREALAEYDTACALDPYYPASHKQRLRALYVLGDVSTAAKLVRSKQDDRTFYLPHGLLVLADAEGPEAALTFYEPLISQAGPAAQRLDEEGFEVAVRTLPYVMLVVSCLPDDKRGGEVKRLHDLVTGLAGGTEGEIRSLFARALDAMEKGSNEALCRAFEDALRHDPVLHTFFLRQGLLPRVPETISPDRPDD